MRVILKGFIEVPRADRDRVIAQLDQHIRLTRAEPGCLKFEINAWENNPFCFDVEEEFVDSQAYWFHQQRLKGSTWATATGNVKRDYTVKGLEED